jgi:hypothetical protein
MGFLGRIETTEMLSLPRGTDAGPKSPTARDKPDTGQPAAQVILVWRVILRLLSISCWPQIFEAVVGFVAVSMVDFVSGPLACNERPDDAMRENIPATKRDSDVPFVKAPSDLSGELAVQPPKLACLWLIAKTLAKLVNRDVGVARPHGWSVARGASCGQ